MTPFRLNVEQARLLAAEVRKAVVAVVDRARRARQNRVRHTLDRSLGDRASAKWRRGS